MLSLRMISTTGVATLLLLVVAMPVSAAPLWNVNFEADTVGSSPGVGPAIAGVANTRPTSIFTASGSHSVLVQNGYSDTTTTASLSSNVLVITDPGAGQAGVRFDGADTDAVSTGIYEIEFDTIRESTGDGNNSFLDIRNTDGQIISSLLLNPAASGVLLTQYTSPGNFLNAVSAGGVDYSDALNVRYRFDFVAGTQEVFVNDVSLLSANLPGSGAVNLDRFDFFTGSAAADIWVIDNVTGTVIPEPASASLLAVAGLLGLGASRRRRS